MLKSITKGISFGLTSSIITTIGLMVGLESGTGSKLAVIGGILTIAVADSFSDALAMHISEESTHHTEKNIWMATIATLLSKFIFAITFVIPVILLPLKQAIWTSISWGALLITGLSYEIAIKEKENPYRTIAEHLIIASAVIIVAHFVGVFVNNTFA